MKRRNHYTEEELYWINGGNTGMLPTKITPSVIYTLDSNEVFVFGSNAKGMHAGGAARIAYNEFGAEWGNDEGMQGHSYAIPTMEGEDILKTSINKFISFASEHPGFKFLVTPIGCGIAGYTPAEVAPMFKEAIELDNIYLPVSFWKVLMSLES